MFEVGQKVRRVKGVLAPPTYAGVRIKEFGDKHAHNTANLVYDQPVKAGESDPNGTDAHAPGAKLDAGKVRPSLIIEGMARALWAVAEVASFGAAKYTPGGWVLVPQGQERYADAGYRHLLKRAMGEQADSDSKLEHLAHEAWNSLAKLDLYLREKEKASANA